MAAKYIVGDLVMYTAGAGGVLNHDNVAAAAVKFVNAAGNNGNPFFAENSRLIGNVIAVNAAGPFTYTVQFGPTAAAANPDVQVLLIPEAQLKKITILNDVVVAGVGGSRKRRQSKKKNQRKHHNNQ